MQAQPGGVFSSGQLEEQTVTGATGAEAQQPMSLESLPQLRLAPSVGRTLPKTGQVGDMFLTFQPLQGGGAQLWICAGFSANLPQWQPVQMGPAVAGGNPI